MSIFILLNIVFGLLGIYIAYKIKTNKALKKKGEQMVCLVGHKCDDVIFSDNSKFFGINLEIMGVIYYALIFIFYIIYLILPNLITEPIVFIALGITFGGFLFSIYLTYIQVFKLKSFCSWCLSSATASSVIFFSSYSMVLVSKPEIIDFIAQIQDYIKAFESITLILSLVIFTILEITILKSLKDFKINIKEDQIIKNISQIGWFVLFLFILNNVGVYLPERFLTQTDSVMHGIFLVEIILIFIISLNSMINQMQVLPKIRESSLNKNSIPVQKLSNLRKIAVFQGILSLILWYFVFYLNFLI